MVLIEAMLLVSVGVGAQGSRLPVLRSSAASLERLTLPTLSMWPPMKTWVGPAAMLLTVLSVVFENDALLPFSALLEAALYFYAAASLISYMLHDHKVTADELFAAAATFTLLAWGFAYAYFVCQAWYPGSFTGFEPERQRTWMELLFYSFTNLSATGLGDVLPVSAPARVLTMLEQFAGVGYIATVVSRLIGLTIVRERG